MTGFTVRPAEPADAPEVAEVFLAARAEMTYLPHLHTDDETREWITTVVLPTRRVWVAEATGTAAGVAAAGSGIGTGTVTVTGAGAGADEREPRVVGFAALIGDHLDHLYVHPSSQRRGIGSALLDQAKAASSGELSLFVFARNARARALYERHGFVPVAFGDGSDNEECEPDVSYEWSREAGSAHKGSADKGSADKAGALRVGTREPGGDRRDGLGEST